MEFSLNSTARGTRIRLWSRRPRRRAVAVRIMLAILAAQGIVIGLWAVLAPSAWFANFPGFGMRWVAGDGPFNHHLAADVGAFFLALGAVSLFALLRGGAEAARAAGIGWTVMAAPHLVYHLSHHPHGMPTGSYTLSVLAAASLLILGVAVVVVTPRTPRPTDPVPLEIRLFRRGAPR